MGLVCDLLQFYAKDENGTLTTLETRDPLMMRVIGQRQELSFYDVKLANKAYCDSQFQHLFTFIPTCSQCEVYFKFLSF